MVALCKYRVEITLVITFSTRTILDTVTGGPNHRKMNRRHLLSSQTKKSWDSHNSERKCGKTEYNLLL